MAQAWESAATQAQGNNYATALAQLRAAQASKDIAAQTTARAAMAAASTAATQSRANDGYKTDSSGLNQTALDGYVADSTNTKFTPVVPTPVVDPMAEFNKYQNQLKEQQKQATIASLDKALINTNANLATEKSAIQPAYYDKKNQASSQSQLNAKNLAEYMANRGSTNSGMAVQSELSRSNQLQGDLGSLNKQEQLAYDDVSKRTTQAQQSYNSDVASAVAGIESNALQNTINNWTQQQQLDYQKSRDTISDQRYTTEYRDSQAQQKLTNEATILENQIKSLELDRAKTGYLTPQEKVELESAKFNLEQAKKLAPYDLKQAQIAIQNVQSQISNRNSSSTSRSTSGSSSTNSTKTMNNLYQQALTEYNNMAPGAVLNNLKDYTDEVISQVGSANYNKLLSQTQDRLYQAMVSGYNDFTVSAAYSSVVNDRERIISQIGQENYNKLYNSVKSKLTKMEITPGESQYAK